MKNRHRTTLNKSSSSTKSRSTKSKIKGGALAAGALIPIALGTTLFGLAGAMVALNKRKQISAAIKNTFAPAPAPAPPTTHTHMHTQTASPTSTTHAHAHAPSSNADDDSYDHSKSKAIVDRFTGVQTELDRYNKTPVTANENRLNINFDDQTYTWWQRSVLNPANAHQFTDAKAIAEINAMEDSFFQSYMSQYKPDPHENVSDNSSVTNISSYLQNYLSKNLLNRSSPHPDSDGITRGVIGQGDHAHDLYSGMGGIFNILFQTKFNGRVHDNPSQDSIRRRNNHLAHTHVQNTNVGNADNHTTSFLIQRISSRNTNDKRRLLEYLSIFQMEIMINHTKKGKHYTTQMYCKTADSTVVVPEDYAVIGWQQSLLDTQTFLEPLLVDTSSCQSFLDIFQPKFNTHNDTRFDDTQIGLFVGNLTQFHMFILNQFFKGIRFTQNVFAGKEENNIIMWRLIVFGIMEQIVHLVKKPRDNSGRSHTRSNVKPVLKHLYTALYTYINTPTNPNAAPHFNKSPPYSVDELSNFENKFMVKLWSYIHNKSPSPNNTWDTISDFMTDIIHHVYGENSPIDASIYSLLHGNSLSSILDHIGTTIPYRVVVINIDDIVVAQPNNTYTSPKIKHMAAIQTNMARLQRNIEDLREQVDVLLNLDTPPNQTNINIPFVFILFKMSLKNAMDSIEALYAQCHEKISGDTSVDITKHTSILKQIIYLSKDADRIVRRTRDKINPAERSAIPALNAALPFIHTLIQTIELTVQHARAMEILQFQERYNVKINEWVYTDPRDPNLRAFQIFILQYDHNVHYLTPRDEVLRMNVQDLQTNMTHIAMAIIDALNNPDKELKGLIDENPTYFKKPYTPGPPAAPRSRGKYTQTNRQKNNNNQIWGWTK